MGERMRALDWRFTALGPLEKWPQSLRSAVSICLGSRFPMVVLWGPQLIMIYNDDYAPLLGDKHPWALGRSIKEVWSEIADVITPLMEGVMKTGEATWIPDGFLALERRGTSEETYFSYSFGPVLGPMDDYYIAEGSHLRLFDKLGSHRISHEGASGMHFAVWAPNAKRVSVVGPFNDWDGRRHSMRLRQDTGIWEIFVPDVGEGQPYKYEIVGAQGVRLPLKADPVAFRSELRPATASVTASPVHHEWGDDAHRAFWSKADHRRQPMSCLDSASARPSMRCAFYGPPESSRPKQRSRIRSRRSL